MKYERHDYRLGTEIDPKKKNKKYTHSDVWSAYLRGVSEGPKWLSVPEWYTVLASGFTTWHKERFNKYPL